MKRLLFSLGAVLLLARPVAAQQAQPFQLHADQRIRFTAEASGFPYSVAGTVAEVRGDSALVIVHGMQSSVALRDIQTLQVSQGHGPRARWAAIGLLGGAAAGVLVVETGLSGARRTETTFGLCSTGPCYDHRTTRTLPYPFSRFAEVGGGAAALGLLAGWFAPGERWKAVLPQVQASSSPSGGVRLAVSLRR